MGCLKRVYTNFASIRNKKTTSEKKHLTAVTNYVFSFIRYAP